MDEKYFENLARGGKVQENADQTAEAAANEMGNYEVELARAESAVASRRTTANSHTRAAASARREPREAEDRERGESWDDAEPEGQLTVDVYQTPEYIVVESAIAGVKPDDIDINVTADSIAIRGARRRNEQVRDEDYFYRECYWGRFARSVILPQEVDPERADVTFKNGILTVYLPKVNKKKTHKLKVRLD